MTEASEPETVVVAVEPNKLQGNNALPTSGNGQPERPNEPFVGDDTGESPKEEKKHDENDAQEPPQTSQAATAMTLDVAYQSLETLRQVNLQVEFGKEIPQDECVPCLREEHRKGTNVLRPAQSRFRHWMTRKVVNPCLACGTPVCKSHRSKEFGQQNIAICSDCAHLFSLNYIIKHIIEQQNGDNKDATTITTTCGHEPTLNDMLEVFDRAMLVLQYSSQCVLDDVAQSLEQNTSRHNLVGLGSSATGVVAGGLGVAAAATIFTPVGPPLLVASILFGGSATAATAGSEAVNYRCEPNQMADRILTLHSIVTGIAKLPQVLREKSENNDEIDPTVATTSTTQETNQSSLHWTRTAMNGLKPLTAGALSAVSIVTEAREMKNTVDKIRAGNPCEKAERLRTIQSEIGDLPRTEDLSQELTTWMKTHRSVKPKVKAQPETETPE